MPISFRVKNNLFAFAIAILSAALLPSCSRQPTYPLLPVSGQDVVLDVSTLRREIPQFYTYQYQGKSVSFFILKLHDRTLSFLDACASCYMHKRGYRYGNGFVTCRACNMKFSVFKLEKGLGGCYPIRIEGRMENGQHRIPVKTLEAAADKF